MTSRLMEKLKETLGSDSRPVIPLAHPEPSPASASASAAREIKSSPRVHFKGAASSPPLPSTSPPAKQHLLDAAHSPPSVLSQHLGPPTIEHKYPRDSKWRRHSISAQEQHYLR
ncbi:hypothetical protein ED733_004923 [Metarhizium rileyi]|uniref:Xylitol dehydrogenase n=1 Tax=Metarhizium rileyi (strain RCEF 4871) TaxID=1649241 RepID=A0A5C6GIW8_METRR|nr:hypothetical protein ED733_004923 [Metarhizium rileyi]